MSGKKNAKVTKMIEQFRGHRLSPQYLGYFVHFNTEEYYEAHDVLEHLWLDQRAGPNYGLYKGLIQLAGAFVHLQKNRPSPAGRLFKLAQTNLEKYPDRHEDLDVTAVLELIADWYHQLELRKFEANPFHPGQGPKLAPIGFSADELAAAVE